MKSIRRISESISLSSKPSFVDEAPGSEVACSRHDGALQVVNDLKRFTLRRTAGEINDDEGEINEKRDGVVAI